MEVLENTKPNGIKGMRAPRDSGLTIWPEVRCAYVEAEQKPSYEELAERFHVNLVTLRSTASEEGWALKRSRFMDSMSVKADVSLALIELARDRKETSTAIANAVLIGVRKITAVMESIPDATKPRAAVDILNTASFAVCNFAKALQSAGLIDVPKELSDTLGKGGAGRDFLKGALNQINVSVSLAQKDSAAVTVNEAPAPYVATPAPTPPAPSEELPPE